MRFEEVAPLLAAIRDGNKAGPDLIQLAEELGENESLLRHRIDELQAAGLLLLGEPGDPPLIMRAGRQYLELRGEIEAGVLHFLPHVIDDLHTRAALLAGGVILIDEFRHAINHGAAVEHARGIIPDAFAQAVDAALAIELFAAAIALTVRLSANERAACVAEEILAVELMENARAWLEMKKDRGELDPLAAREATGELESLFNLFEDDDVLDMFEMAEPGDAAVAGHSYIRQQLGVADQRLEAWFKPFGGVAPTGYLDTDS